jgi:hypothetical protein
MGAHSTSAANSDLSLDADELRSALQAITSDTSNGSGDLDSLTDTVNNLIRDPSILESLGSIFGGAPSAVAAQPAAGETQKSLVNGALITSFKLSSAPTATAAPAVRQQSLPRYPSRMPDPGLTSLIRPQGRKIPNLSNRMNRRNVPARDSSESTLGDGGLGVFNGGDGGLHYDDSDRTIQELAGIISEAVRAEVQNEASARKRKHSDMAGSQNSRVTAGVFPEHLLSPSMVVPSPRPPQYRPPATATNPGAASKETTASRPRLEDKHVKAMGFPPALTGMTVPR